MNLFVNQPAMETQNFPPAMGSQTLCTIVPNQSSPKEDFGFVVNVFNLIQFAGSVMSLRPALGLYTSLCPNKDGLNELRDILSEWKDVLDGLEPEQRARFEADHPGEFDSMMRGIKLYEKRLADLKVDLTNNPWARYLPLKTDLAREYKGLWTAVRNMHRDYYTTTKKYRNAASAPAAPPTTAITSNDVEMVPISNGTPVENTERRLIDQGTIDQTERYRSIMQVYASYNVPPSMQSTYTAIQNLVTSLLSPGPPEGSVTISPA